MIKVMIAEKTAKQQSAVVKTLSLLSSDKSNNILLYICPKIYLLFNPVLTTFLRIGENAAFGSGQ
jgi:hypothetical protein